MRLIELGLKMLLPPWGQDVYKRQAIGLSEVSDAFTFVVSEETGGISVTYNGTFRHDLTLEEFETELRAFLVPEENKTSSWKERLFGRVTK